MISPHRIRKALLYALVWILLALCFSGQSYLEYALRGSEPSWPALFIWQATGWAGWGILTPLILRLAGKYPMDRERWLKNLPVYLAAACVLSVVHLLFTVALSWWLMQKMRPGYEPLLQTLQSNIFQRLTWRLFVFAIITIGCHGWEAQRRYRSEQQKATELQTHLVEAQLAALKMQLHPHFLFNTLHSLSELLHKDVAAADEMLVRLGDFLRATLQAPGSPEIPLRKELEFLNCYLDIERLRLQKRLEIRMDIDPATLETAVPNWILQPVVENAVRHAIAPRSSVGKLEIKTLRRDSILRIEVKDNGPGLSAPHTLESYFQKGVGLSNTRARLERMYGSRQRFVLENAPDGGLVVVIEIPGKESITS